MQNPYAANPHKLAERLQALSSKWLRCSTTGNIEMQVEFLERLLPAALRDVARLYADAIETGDDTFLNAQPRHHRLAVQLDEQCLRLAVRIALLNRPGDDELARIAALAGVLVCLRCNESSELIEEAPTKCRVCNAPRLGYHTIWTAGPK